MTQSCWIIQSWSTLPSCCERWYVSWLFAWGFLRAQSSFTEHFSSPGERRALWRRQHTSLSRRLFFFTLNYFWKHPPSPTKQSKDLLPKKIRICYTPTLDPQQSLPGLLHPTTSFFLLLSLPVFISHTSFPLHFCQGFVALLVQFT